MVWYGMVPYHYHNDMYLQSFIERNNQQASTSRQQQGPAAIEELSVLDETVVVESQQNGDDVGDGDGDGDGADDNDPNAIVTQGFGVTHPRQKRLIQQRQVTQQDKAAEALSCLLPTDPLATAVSQFQQHVPFSASAQRDWNALNEALTALQEQLKPPKALQAKAKFLLKDDISRTYRQPFESKHLYLHKAAYEANDPIEDRSTVVIGQDFVFAGIWDGHGGPQCAEFTQKTVFEHFAASYRELHRHLPSQRIPTALKQAFLRTNREYYQYARTQNERQAYFAGTCAVACFLDLSDDTGAVTTYTANLGDSRAVMGTLQPTGVWQTRALSVDHTADNLLERQRIQALHPHDPHVVADLSKLHNNHDESDEVSQPAPLEPPDWRVKKMAAFTRSIGDLQLKEKNTSALFNSYMPPGNRIIPRPGILPHKDAVTPTPPYISTEAEVEIVDLPDGVPSATATRLGASTTLSPPQPSFIIIACDGVWDEMTSEEAVDCVGDLLSQYPRSTSTTATPEQRVNIAELFIEKVLEQVVERLRETDEEEKDLTLAELKKRPKGKETDWSRSLLHDDITVVIIQLGSSKSFYRGRRGRSGRGLGGKNASMTSIKSLQKAMLRQNAHRGADPLRALQETLKRDDPERKQVDQQIVDMMDFFEGMNIRHLVGGVHIVLSFSSSATGRSLGRARLALLNSFQTACAMLTANFVQCLGCRWQWDLGSRRNWSFDQSSHADQRQRGRCQYSL